MRLSLKMLSCFSLLLMACPLVALSQILPPVQLNQIWYQYIQESWAKTDTAKVTVNFNAALDKVGLDTVNAYVLGNLKKIAANADWHVTEFTRTKDSTGLEKIFISAEARLPENALAGLREKAESLSKAGETYTIAAIDFTPSLAATEETRKNLRAAIYEQAKQEVARLNQVYPDQKYFLNSIRFDVDHVQPMGKEMRIMAATTDGAAAQPAATGLSVDAKVVQSAQVTIASLTPEHAVSAAE